MKIDKIVVLGGSGFLGSHVVHAFRQRGLAVEVCSRKSGVDARQEGSLRGFLERTKPSILINCAHHGGGIAYNAEHPVAIFEDNLLMGFHAVRAARACGIQKFVNILGNSAYPGAADLYRESGWWDGPLDPSVAASALPRKAQWVHAWALSQPAGLAAGLRSIHLVLPNMYGPGDHTDPGRSHALMALVKKVWEAKRTGRGEVEIWGSGRPVREWLYVEDAAEGIARATEGYDETEILNLGSGKGCSIRELAETIRELMGWRGEFLYNTSRPDGAPRKIFDVSKMRVALGWTPPTELRDGIQKTIEWFAGVEHASAAAR